MLDHTVMLFNVIQNPDGRVAGTPAERQRLRPQPRLHDPVAVGDAGLRLGHAEVAAARDARPARLRHADAHRGDDQAAQPEHRLRPLAEVEPGRASTPTRRPWRRPATTSRARSTTGAPTASDPASGICPNGEEAGPAEAEGWDDWGPFYTPMYSQHVGLNGSTVEMCNQTETRLPDQPCVDGDAGTPGLAHHPGDRGLVVDPVRPRQPQRAAPRRARALPPWRRQRPAARVLPAAVRRRQQLDGGVPDRLHHPDGWRAAQRA